MNLHSRLLHVRSLFVAAGTLLLSATQMAHAQTWVNNRQGPALREILTVDETGEPNWIWGAEDVAGNGLNAFPNPEQAIDARTAYVNTSNSQFFSRVYFSIVGDAPGEVTTYLFLDTDQNNATGGSATDADLGGLEPSFAADPTEGGYDYVIRVRRAADGTTVGWVYNFNNSSRLFEQANVQATQLLTESGEFLDPIRINQNAHGYVQSVVDLSAVNLTEACDADIFVRTTNQTQNLGNGDLTVGRKRSCVPTLDTNNVPDVIRNPPIGCTTNAECPNNGICVNGVCVLAMPCFDDTDCPDNMQCTDGRCVYRGGDNCTSNADCDGLICRQGQCVPCTTDVSCGPGMVCQPDGRCVPANGGTATATATSTATGSGVSLAPGEKLQGGACACSTVGRRGGSWLGLFGLLGFTTILGRRIKRERNR